MALESEGTTQSSVTFNGENKNVKNNKSGWQKFSEGLPYFLINNYGFFVIPLFIFTVFALALAFFDIWPFGTAIISSYDMLAQICPILEHFFDVFQGESGLFHSFHVGNGMDMFGILAYCAVSPFTFLFLLAGKAGSLYMVSIVLPLKYALIGISAFIFLRVYFKKIPQYLQVVLALLYAYSGYSYVANTYIIWMDIMMYMPIVGAGIIEFSKKGKLKVLILGLTLCIYACFSIVCFSFFTLFPILVCYVLICKRRDEYGQFLSKLCLAFIVAVSLTLPVLLPSLMAYTKAGRNTGLFSRVFELMSEDKVLAGELNIHLYEKFSYIFCDSIFILLAITYFLKAKKGDKLATFLLVALIYLLLPCIIDESMLLLNMGSYYSYALRFGFLLSFYFLFVGATAVEEIIEDKSLAVEPNKVKSGISLVVIALLSTLGVLFTFRFFKFILDGEFKEAEWINSIFGGAGDAKPFEDFFPLFAHSEGGLEGSAVLFLVALVVFGVTAILVGTKCIKLKDAVSYVCIFALSQSVFFNFALVKGDKQSYSAQKFDYYSELLDGIDKIEEDEYYRLKNYDYYISSDSPIILGCYSNTLFSSMADAKNITVADFFGYGGSHTNSTKSNGGTVFSDAFLNYKYMVVEADDKSKIDTNYYTYTGISTHRTPSVKVSYTKKLTNKKTSTKVATWEDISTELHGKGKWSRLRIEIDGGYFKGYLNGEHVYTVKMDTSEITEVSAVTKNAFGSVRNLKVWDEDGNQISGQWNSSNGWKVDGDVFTTEPDDFDTKLSFSGEKGNLKAVEGEVMFTAGADSDDHIGLAVTAGDTTYRVVIEPNVNYMVYKVKYAFPGAMLLNSAELNFEGKTDKECYEQIADMLYGKEGFEMSGSTISNSETKALYEAVKDSGVKYKLVKNGILFDEITVQKGQMLVVSYVNLDGYRVYVNGVESELKENSLDIMMVELNEGKNTVEIKYSSPYTKFIIIGIIMAAALTALVWFVYKKRTGIYEKISEVLPYMAVILAVALTLFFFVFPTFVCINKFIGTYSRYLFNI